MQVLHLLILYNVNLMKTLTIFTPTYNRAHTLVRTYQSLQNQTCKDFEWLIIDDGSTDNTGYIVKKWINEADFKISYIYKENGGLHTGYNVAIENIFTELCVCIDSDDFMPNDAVEKITKFWNKNKSDDVAGILGLDFTLDGKPIGGYFKEGISKLKMCEMATKYKHYGDVKVVHRTTLLKEVAPMPTFDNEKNFNPIYLFYKIDMNYPLLLLNDNICFVEYQPDGMTNNIFKQYINSPKSFSELRRLIMSRPDVSIYFKFRQAIHYVSSQIMIKNSNWLKESPKKILTLLAAPFGILLFIYIKYKTK